MLDFHKENKCAATIAVLEVPLEEASRFGIMNTDENDRIYELKKNRLIQKVILHLWEYIFSHGQTSRSIDRR